MRRGWLKGVDAEILGEEGGMGGPRGSRPVISGRRGRCAEEGDDLQVGQGCQRPKRARRVRAERGSGADKWGRLVRHGGDAEGGWASALGERACRRARLWSRCGPKVRGWAGERLGRAERGWAWAAVGLKADFFFGFFFLFPILLLSKSNSNKV